MPYGQAGAAIWSFVVFPILYMSPYLILFKLEYIFKKLALGVCHCGMQSYDDFNIKC